MIEYRPILRFNMMRGCDGFGGVVKSQSLVVKLEDLGQ